MFILLTASDNHSIIANYKIMQYNSKMIRETDNIKNIHLPNISKFILYKIIKYCNYHSNKIINMNNYIKHELIYKNIINCNWDIEFIKCFSYQNAIDLLAASTYLIIPSLIELSKLHISILLKNTTMNELHVQFDDYVIINI